MEYQKLYSPLSICGKQLNNRIVVPPMADFGATNPDCRINSRHLARYGSLARGGAGLIITEACIVNPALAKRYAISLCDDSCVPSLSVLGETVRQYGAACLAQISNYGIPYIADRSIAGISPTGLKEYRHEFVSAARRCFSAGLDGIELHSAHGFFLSQMLEMNGRCDSYGGSLANRLRFLAETISEIRESTSSGFIIAVRIGNSNLAELIDACIILEKSGCNLLDISYGLVPYAAPSGFGYDPRIYAAAAVRQCTSLPVICVGNIMSGETAESILLSGYADLAAIGRGHLCDPEWANKTFRGERPVSCLGCPECLWYSDGRLCPAKSVP